MNRIYHPLILTAVWLCQFLTGQLPAADHEALYQERLRPQFHFTARYWEDYTLHPQPHQEGWMNDMNGLMWNDGVYHFFAQRWWSAWLHAESRDLLHWTERKPAFGKGGTFGGTQSGGGVVDIENTSGLGDGKTPPMLAFWSSTDNLNQCMSFSRDKGVTWEKYAGNPVLKHAYRDPRVFRHEPSGKWIMILYGPTETSTVQWGFNGENNDAHHLRTQRVGDWVCSIVRVFPDGKVIADDGAGRSEGKIDPALQQAGAAGFIAGGKTSGGEFLSGDIAEIAVYDRPLTDAETGELLRKMNTGEKPGMDPALYLSGGQAFSDADGKIERWPDLSGHGRDLTQADAAQRPAATKDGGRHALHFSGAQVLKGPAVLDEGDDSFTIAACWRRESPAGSEVICEQNAAENHTGARAALLSVPDSEPQNVYLLFSSTNLREWTKLPGEIPNSYECPDMFPLPVEGEPGTEKWVVVDGSGDYVTGSFDGTRFTTESPKRKGDYGRNFYATMTFGSMPAEDNRRIQMAWMRGWDDYPADMPFNQQASIPCGLTLRRLPEGLVLCRQPIKELAGISDTIVNLTNVSVKPGENPLQELNEELCDIWLTLDTVKSTCTELMVRLRGNEVRYSLPEHRVTSAGSAVELKSRNGTIRLRMLLDRLSLETFGNDGEVSLTNIIHQTPAAPFLEINAIGGEAVLSGLTVKRLRSVWAAATK